MNRQNCNCVQIVPAKIFCSPRLIRTRSDVIVVTDFRVDVLVSFIGGMKWSINQLGGHNIKAIRIPILVALSIRQ